jgi:GR25 family glycosyltransferase involved in LPS biosynthesis
MVDLSKIAYSICHVPSDSETRMKVYENLINSMPKELHNFPASTVHIKNTKDLDVLKKEFNHIKLNSYIYPHLWTQNNQQIIGGDGPYLDVKWPIKGGEIGLYLSVYKTFKRFLESPYDYLIWLEDDVDVMPNMIENLSKYMESIDFQFDAISLGMQDFQLEMYRDFLHDIENLYLSTIYQVFWAGAILFSRSGIAKVISDLDQNGFTYPFDWYIYNVRHSNVEPTRFFVYNIKPEHPELFKPNNLAGIESSINNTSKIDINSI